MKAINLIVASLLVLVTSADAQQPTYAPPDADLWRQMWAELDLLSMPGPSHRTLSQIRQGVERQAQMNAARMETETQRQLAPKRPQEPAK